MSQSLIVNLHNKLYLSLPHLVDRQWKFSRAKAQICYNTPQLKNDYTGRGNLLYSTRNSVQCSVVT